MDASHGNDAACVREHLLRGHRTGTTAGRTVVGKAAMILLTCLDGAHHSITEIAATTGLPLSTAHRLVHDLATWRILERADDGSYCIGLFVRLIGASGRVTASLRERAPLVLADLVETFGTEARLGVLDNGRVTAIEQAPGRRVGIAAGLPVHATAMGKALLAHSPAEVVTRIVARGLTAYTPFTLTTPDRLRHALVQTRLRHLAMSRWELHPGHSALAVPVFGPGGTVAAAIELRVDNPLTAMNEIRPALSVAASSLSRELAGSVIGFRPADP